MTTIKIGLRNLGYFAHHGIYQEEQTAGGEFNIDMEISYQADRMITSLDSTVDYTKVEAIIREIMKTPYPLLETVGMEIVNRVKSVFPTINEINITISKINPPLINFRGQLSVSIQKRYDL